MTRTSERRAERRGRRSAALAALVATLSGTGAAQVPAIGEALDAPQLAWTTGAPYPWFGQTNVFRAGGSAARSALLPDRTNSWLELSITGPVQCAFWARTDSEAGFDFLRFFVDGAEQPGALSGDSGWVYRRAALAAGPHVLRWSYAKDEYVSQGSDAAWVDDFHLLSATTHYVAADSAAPAAPYTSWATAARNIQDAIDAAAPEDEIVVSNGVYALGGRVVHGVLSNRVALTERITVRSVNGPPATTILGGGPPPADAVRCAYVGSNALLAGFTLAAGRTRDFAGDGDTEQSGGGAWCEPSGLLSNCVLTGNAASSNGGGVAHGTLYDCTLAGNACYYGGGGAFDARLIGCTLSVNTSLYYGGGACSGALLRSTLAGNRSSQGGGAYEAMLDACTVVSNRALHGGGVYGEHSALSNCVLAGNAANDGGGTYLAQLVQCRVSDNVAGNSGGGCFLGSAERGELFRNRAGYDGGGAFATSLRSCGVWGNHANHLGGGIGGGAVIQHCTVVANSAANGGGADSAGFENCIVYYNAGAPDPNFTAAAGFLSSCTYPQPSYGAGNFTNPPGLASFTHLAANAPSQGRGNPLYATAVDLDGDDWRAPPAVGCDEPRATSATGALALTITADYTNVAPDFPVTFTAFVEGHPSSITWSFGDGAPPASNCPVIAHAFAATGTYAVVASVRNESAGSAAAATVAVSVLRRTYYVAAGHPLAHAPYASWASAAATIQDAVDAAEVAGALVLVSNGVYASGGRAVAGSMTNRAAITKPLQVRSVNGAAHTVIQGGGALGDGAIRCAYLAAGAVLDGFTLTGGHTRVEGDLYPERYGGGVWCERSARLVGCVIAGNASYFGGGGVYQGSLSNCLVTDNVSAEGTGGGVNQAVLYGCRVERNHAYSGGGASASWLYECTVTSNAADWWGGGTYLGVLRNCLVQGNSAADSSGGSYYTDLLNCTVVGNAASVSNGGVMAGTVENSIVYFNDAPSRPNGFSYRFFWTCTTPLPTNGAGNIADDPRLVTREDGIVDLQPASPCIDAGQQMSWMTNATDLGRSPRIANGRPDLGALEFRFEASLRGCLAGAWDSTGGVMRAGHPPPASPYSAASVAVPAVPSNAVDWMLVSVRPTPTSPPSASVSALLLPDGSLCNAQGGSNVYIEARGDLYVVLSHRNHLSVMSAAPVFTSRFARFDFAASPGLLWAGTNGVRPVAAGRWGMIAGDADGDGAVDTPDRLLHATQAH